MANDLLEGNAMKKRMGRTKTVWFVVIGVVALLLLVTVGCPTPPPPPAYVYSVYVSNESDIYGAYPVDAVTLYMPLCVDVDNYGDWGWDYLDGGYIPAGGGFNLPGKEANQWYYLWAGADDGSHWEETVYLDQDKIWHLYGPDKKAVNGLAPSEITSGTVEVDPANSAVYTK